MADQTKDTAMMDPYWSCAFSLASTYDWNVEPSHDLNQYFLSSSGLSSPSPVISEDVKWRIEYDRIINKHRISHSELDYGYYIDVQNILRSNVWIHANVGQHSYNF